MFNHKLINIGAMALMIYCFMEFRSKYYPDGVKLPISTKSSPAKYNLDWDLNEENSNTSTTAKIVHYLLSDKIKEQVQKSPSIIVGVNSLKNAVNIGDTVGLIYTIINDGQPESPKELSNFLLSANAPLSGIIVGMTTGAEKTINIKKGSREAELFAIEGNEASVRIKIKSLSKVTN